VPLFIMSRMAVNVRYLSQLKRGQKAIIDSFTDYDLSLKLLEMGCIPGEVVEVIRIAPLGDPIAVAVSGYVLTVRKDEAATILVRSSE
jgi:ferrous iron transport protein A